MDKQVYPGKIINKMPELIEAGNKPMSFYDVLVWRIAALKSNNEELIKKACEHNCDTGDMIFTGTDETLKIQLDSDIARQVNAETPLFDGGIELTQDQYKKVNGIYLPKFSGIQNTGLDKIILGKHMNKQQVLENEILFNLARKDKDVLGEYFDLCLEYLKDHGMRNYNTLLGLRIKTKTDRPVGYLVSISKIIAFGSEVHATVRLSDAGGYLIRKERAESTLHQQ